MSSNPVPINRQQREQLDAKARKRASWRADALYVCGAALVTSGVGLAKIKFGLIAAGGFCLLLPVLELTSSFIRGLRKK
jgi:hypothetical protein